MHGFSFSAVDGEVSAAPSRSLLTTKPLSETVLKQNHITFFILSRYHSSILSLQLFWIILTLNSVFLNLYGFGSRAARQYSHLTLTAPCWSGRVVTKCTAKTHRWSAAEFRQLEVRGGSRKKEGTMCWEKGCVTSPGHRPLIVHFIHGKISVNVTYKNQEKYQCWVIAYFTIISVLFPF